MDLVISSDKIETPVEVNRCEIITYSNPVVLCKKLRDCCMLQI